MTIANWFLYFEWKTGYKKWSSIALIISWTPWNECMLGLQHSSIDNIIVVGVFHFRVDRHQWSSVELYRPIYKFGTDKELEKLFTDLKNLLMDLEKFTSKSLADLSSFVEIFLTST